MVKTQQQTEMNGVEGQLRNLNVSTEVPGESEVCDERLQWFGEGHRVSAV